MDRHGTKDAVRTRLVTYVAVGAALAGLMTLALGACEALAGSFSGSVGIEGARSGEARSEAVIGLLAREMGGGDALVGVLRYDDRQIGSGSGFVLGGGIRIASGVRLRAMGTRFIGDQDYRALRLRMGPQLALANGTLGLFYTHDTSQQAPDAQGAIAELVLALNQALAAKVTASLASTGGESGHGGSAGLIWSVVPHFELSAEAGLARNLGAAGAGPASGGVLGRLLGAPETPEGEADALVATTVLGARVTFP